MQVLGEDKMEAKLIDRKMCEGIKTTEILTELYDPSVIKKIL